METYKASDFAKAGVFPGHASAEASLTLFGTASFTSFVTALQDVLPRHASAEGPLASLGATKKRGLGVTASNLSSRGA